MSNVNEILIFEAVADLVRAFSYETNAYLKKEGEAGKSKLHSSENWKPIFDKVAHRYIEDLKKRGLDPKKRVNVDMNALIKAKVKENKYLNLLQSRPEIQTYLRKQIKLLTDEGAERIEKYRNPREYEEIEKEIEKTTPTPKLTKSQQQIKDAEVGLRKEPVLKKGSERHFGGQEFEMKVAKAMAKKKIDSVKWLNNKVTINFPGEGESIADKIYNLLQKNPSKAKAPTVSYDDVYKIINEIDPSVEQMSKSDFEYNGTKYEVKKQNIYNKSIFGEVWKVATDSSLKKLTKTMGQDGIFYYNNIIQKIVAEPLFQNKITQAIRSAMLKNNIHMIALCGSASDKTEVGVFSPKQLEFSVGLGSDRMGTKRFTLFVKAKVGTKPEKSLGSYGNMEEAIKIYLLTSELLLKENVRL